MEEFTFIAFGKEISIEAEGLREAMIKANREWLDTLPEFIKDPNGWWFAEGNIVRWSPGIVD